MLQGADYPLYSPKIIHNFFEQHSKEEFCKSHDISISIIKNDYMKVAGFHTFDLDIKNHPFNYLISRFFMFLNSFGIKYRTCFFHDNGEKWHIYHGWAHWSLSYNCIKYIFDFYKKNKKFNIFMKHRFPPDELYFQTVIQNSIYKNMITEYTVSSRKNCKMTNLNLTYFEYPKLVTVFSRFDDLDELKKTGALFIRKVWSDESKPLLDKIDKEKEILSTKIYETLNQSL